jgi:multidrug efflux system membrane fusion protein
MPPIEEPKERRRSNEPSEPQRTPAAAPAPAPAINQPNWAAPRKRSYRAWIILGVLGLAAIWYLATHRPAGDQTTGGRAGQDGPVPITPGTVAMKDVPIYLTGIGTVQAFNTVTVHSRVDGELNQIVFTEGQDVKEGDPLAIIDPEPFQTALDQAAGKQGEDQAQLENAKLDLARDTDLLNQKVISSQQFDTQKALVAQLEATVVSDVAAVASARVQLNYTTIRSPIAGRVGIREIDQGNIIHAADTNGLVVITQLQPISVLFTLPEQNLRQIHQQSPTGEGMQVVAVDRDDNTILDSGTIAVVNNQIDPTTGTIQLKANFPNPKYQLWPGQFVNARLLLMTRKNGIVVPAQVVQDGPAGSFVYVIQPDNTVQTRPVKVAQVDNNVALIDDGLKAGEKVVVDGQYKLRPGAKVTLPSATPGAHGGGGGGHQHSSPAASPASPA